MDLEIARLFLKVCGFYEKERHAIMDCPLVPFHIKIRITKHVELQNVARTLMNQSQDEKPRIPEV